MNANEFRFESGNVGNSIGKFKIMVGEVLSLLGLCRVNDAICAGSTMQ